MLLKRRWRMLVLTLALAVWPLSAVRGEAPEGEGAGTSNVAAEVDATEAKSQDPLAAVSHLEQEIKRYGAEYRKASDEEKKVIRGQLATAVRRRFCGNATDTSRWRGRRCLCRG